MANAPLRQSYLRLAAAAPLILAMLASLARAADVETASQLDHDAALDEATARRAEAALAQLRTYNTGIRDKQWTAALRELVEIGEPVVPMLITELDRTTRDETLRALAFAMRAIGDPRAVPALIRAIPRTLLYNSSDWSWRVGEDPAIVNFVREHTADRLLDSSAEQPLTFGYRRPLPEVAGALRKLTGTALWELEINFVFLTGGSEQQRLKHQQYRELALDWAIWWSRNWHRFGFDAASAQVELTFAAVGPATRPAGPPRRELPLGEDVRLEPRSTSRAYLPAFDRSPQGSCLDLDTGRIRTPPAQWVSTSNDRPSRELLDWARREGVDLIGIWHKPPGVQQPCRCLMPVDMRLRSVSRNEERIVAGVRAGNRNGINVTILHGPQAVVRSLRSGKPIEFPQLSPQDLSADPNSPTIATFVTREGSCGFLSLKPDLFSCQFLLDEPQP